MYIKHTIVNEIEIPLRKQCFCGLLKKVKRNEEMKKERFEKLKKDNIVKRVRWGHFKNAQTSLKYFCLNCSICQHKGTLSKWRMGGGQMERVPHFIVSGDSHELLWRFWNISQGQTAYSSSYRYRNIVDDWGTLVLAYDRLIFYFGLHKRSFYISTIFLSECITGNYNKVDPRKLTYKTLKLCNTQLFSLEKNLRTNKKRCSIAL